MALSPTVLKLSSLDGKNGFVIDGIQTDSKSGYSVASAGDVNKDGYSDIVVGAFQAGDSLKFSGESYVMFGKASGIAKEFGLSSLTVADGFKMTGLSSFDAMGYSVSSAGDINGDGFSDVFVGSLETSKAKNPDVGFVVFGKASGFADLSLLELDGNNGFRLDGALNIDQYGYSVAAAGDVNGDGVDDMIVGAQGAKAGAGESFVVFGTTHGFERIVDLVALNGSNGFRIDGAALGDGTGASVAGIGDVNGDGIGDLLIGAPGDPLDVNSLADDPKLTIGRSFIVYGSKTAFAPSIDVTVAGIEINGTGLDDKSGQSVAAAGDVNGDGIKDFIIGAPGTDTAAGINSGAAYVIYGKAGGFKAPVNLAALDGADGFSITGPSEYAGAGTSVAGNGDFNGDGIDDVLVGAPGADVGTISNAGLVYLILGKTGGLGATIDLANFSAGDGIRFDGASVSGFAGNSVNFAGDINKDGFDDIIIGAYGASVNNLNGAGQSFVIYGHATTSAPVPTPTPNPGPDPDPTPLPQPGGKILGTPDGDYLTGSGAKDNIMSFEGDDKIFSYAGNDKIHLGNGDDFVDAGLGADTIWGGAGHDTIVGGKGADSVIGGNGSDTASYSSSFEGVKTSLDGSLKQTGTARGDAYISVENLEGSKTGDDVFAGDNFANSLTGNGGNDKLVGNGGGDKLTGGAGSDVLTGGKGADRFVYNATDEGGDVIKDFAAADRIVLDATVFGSGTAGPISAGSFVSSAAGVAVEADDHFLYRTGDHSLWFDVDGSGTGGAVLLATFANGFALMAEHLVLA